MKKIIAILTMVAVVATTGLFDITTVQAATTITVASSTSGKTAKGISANGTTISDINFVSTADKKPALYGKNGNSSYSTGKCSNAVGIYAGSKKNITIKNCTFKNMSGIQLGSCSNVLIENCTFTGCENGIYVNKCSNVTIKNCNFTMNSTGLIQYYQAIYLGDGNKTVTVSDCNVVATNYIHKAYRCGSSKSATKSTGVTFTNCTASGKFNTAYQAIWGDATFTNCKFNFTGSYTGSTVCILEGVSNATSTTVNGCTFYNSTGKTIIANPLKPKVGSKFKNCTFTKCGPTATVAKYGTFTNCTFN